MKKAFVAIFTLLILLIFSLPVLAGEIITSMDDIDYLPTETVNGSILEVEPDQENTDQIVILYKESAENNIATLGLDSDDISAGRTVDDKLDVLEISEDSDTDAIIEEISQNDNVEAVDYDDIAKIQANPNDTLYSKYQANYALVNADKTWNNIGSGSVKVAVIDTGVSANHPDLRGQVTSDGYDVINKTTYVRDLEGHGTAVAGVIAANTNNNLGIAGFAGLNNVKIVPYTALDENGDGSSADILAALNLVANRSDIKVVNLSFGFNKDLSTIRSAILRLYNSGKVIVASSGNSNESRLMYPAAYPEVISVGSVDNDLKRSTPASWGRGSGSNYGTNLDVVAPGTDIASTGVDLNQNTRYSYYSNSGTSFSAPTVSGLAAIMLCHNTGLSNGDIDRIIKNTAKDLNTSGYDIYTGYGIVQFDKALTTAKNTIPTNTENEQPNQTINSSYNLSVKAHSENIGWMNAVGNAQVAGTSGKHLKLEALTIADNNSNLNIIGQAHVANVGDMAPQSEGNMIGTTGQNNAIEAIRFYLDGSDSSKYNIFYRVHVENYGWTNWAKNGDWTGTKGYGLQTEAVQIVVTDNLNLIPNYNSDVTWTFKSK